MTPLQLVPWIWGVWLVSWMLAAFVRDKSVAKQVSGETGHRVVTIVGALLLFGVPHGLAPDFSWPVPTGAAWGLDAVIVLGFAITWWARVTLGRLWSGDVARTKNHHVVDRGPYRFVRHPIYTGIILAAIATALIRGGVRSLAGAAGITLGLYLKARLEERFLGQALGEPYTAYARRTPMLVPFAKDALKNSSSRA